jgi:hypothetical protein
MYKMYFHFGSGHTTKDVCAPIKENMPPRQCAQKKNKQLSLPIRKMIIFTFLLHIILVLGSGRCVSL